MSDFWNDEFAERRPASKGRIWGVRGVATVVTLAFVGAVAWGAYSILADGKHGKKQVMQIALVAPPPPPPPPPPPEVKPPEPEVKEEVKIPEPTPEEPKEADAPPPGEQLALDADGSGTGDGFGLAAKKGGRDITETIGGGNGGNRAQFTWFIGQVQSFLQDQLQKNEKLRTADYRVVLKVWFTPEGKVERFDLVNGTGNGDLDRDLQQAMEQLPKMKVAIPNDLPQPLKLRVTSRGAG